MAAKEAIGNDQVQCRAPGCRTKHRGGQGWQICRCSKVRLCPHHLKHSDTIIGLGLCQCQAFPPAEGKRHHQSSASTADSQKEEVDAKQNPLLLHIPFDVFYQVWLTQQPDPNSSSPTIPNTSSPARRKTPGRQSQK
jgi:hypothetical protein